MVEGSRITQKCRPLAAQVKGAATYENQLDSPNQEPALVGADGLRLVLPILAYFGLAWEDMTTWTSIGEVLLRAVQNPVVVVSVLVSVFNALTDPTTAGVNDSVRAMTYETPHKDIPNTGR